MTRLRVNGLAGEGKEMVSETTRCENHVGLGLGSIQLCLSLGSTHFSSTQSGVSLLSGAGALSGDVLSLRCEPRQEVRVSVCRLKLAYPNAAN